MDEIMRVQDAIGATREDMSIYGNYTVSREVGEFSYLEDRG